MKTLEYRIPGDDRLDRPERVGPPYVPVSRADLNAAFALTGLLLSVASLFVVVQGAHDEPYGTYRRYDALVQVGGGVSLMALWCCWSAAVAVLVAARKLRWGWLVLLLWAAVCVFYLSFSPLGYLEDIEQFVIPPGSRG